MSDNGLLTLASVLLAVLVLTPPVGSLIYAVMDGRPTRLTRIVGPLERAVYRVARIDPAEEQDWKSYTCSLLAFTFASIAAVYLLQRFQGVLPLNPPTPGPWHPSSRSIPRSASRRRPTGRTTPARPASPT